MRVAAALSGPSGPSSRGGPSFRASGRPFAVGLVLSLAAHWMFARALPAIAPRDQSVSLPSEVPVESLLRGTTSGAVGGVPHDRAMLEPGGSTARDNVDALERGGGGDDDGAVEFVLLVTESAPITLVDAPLDAADRSQIQRIETARDRASWDDRRATPHPDDTPFLASGDGAHRERRPEASVDAREGAREAPTATAEGERSAGVGVAERGAGRETEGSAPSSRGGTSGSDEGTTAMAARGAALGADRASPGRGIVGGEGPNASARARVATGRPSVDLGPAATVAEHEGRVRDDTDAELLAAQLFEARADASRRAAAHVGEGSGGSGEGRGVGTGGASGVGGHATPYGPGTGDYAALDTSDGRYRTWLLAQRRRIEEHLVFPRPRQLARDQGTSVVRLVVRRDGSLATAPRVIRSSGFDDLDAAALLAVRGSLPFAPIPADLATGSPALVVTLPIEFANPMVD